MLSKSLILASVLAVGAQPAQKGIDLEQLLPPPTWIAANGEELGFTPDEIDLLKQHVESTRGPIVDLRRDIRLQRNALSEALGAEYFDRADIDAAFERLLQLENEFKRQALNARLDFLDSITPTQRQNVRTSASIAIDQRRILRTRIEAIRRLGKRLDPNTRESLQLGPRVRRIEKLVRRGKFGVALIQTERLLDELPR